MRSRIPHVTARLLFALLLAPASAALAQGTPGAPAAPPAPAARESEAWAFLSAHYDHDHDGRITPAEYTRGADAFARLDLDGDGAITVADCTKPPPSPEALAMRDAVGAQLAALLYLSPPGNHHTLEREALPAAVAALDKNGEGRLQAAEFAAHSRGPDAPFMPPMMATLIDDGDPWAMLVHAADGDGDGALTSAELLAWFDRNDTAHAGRCTAESLRKPTMMAIMGTIARPPERAEPPAGDPAADHKPDHSADHAADHGAPPPGSHASAPPEHAVATPGEMAPDFTLGTVDGHGKITLSSYRGQRPVALVFGSYSCPPFRHAGGRLKQVFTAYSDRVQFLMVYIREAHAIDGEWPITGKGMPIVEDPINVEERRHVAQQCTAAMDLAGMTAVVDDVDDSVNATFEGDPNRLYLIGLDGKVSYKSGPGPTGFDPDELETAIRTELHLGATPAAPGTPPASPPAAKPPVR